MWVSDRRSRVRRHGTTCVVKVAEKADRRCRLTPARQAEARRDPSQTARRNGKVGSKWSNFEIALVAEYAPTESPAAIARRIGPHRTPGAVRALADRRGIRIGVNEGVKQDRKIAICKPVFVEGVLFPSMAAAARELGVVPTAVVKSLETGYALCGRRVWEPGETPREITKRFGWWCALTPSGETIRRPSARSLAAKLGVVPSAVTNALKKRRRCIGCQLWHEPIGQLTRKAA